MAWTIRDLESRDLGNVEWAGSPTHMRYVAASLERVAKGEIAYLSVCERDTILAIGAIDFIKFEDSAVLWQLNVHPDHQSRGIGTFLVQNLEQRAIDRGFTQVELAVEIDNPRAQMLYSRLGYEAAETYVDSWDEEDTKGNVRVHETVCAVMRKRV